MQKAKKSPLEPRLKLFKVEKGIPMPEKAGRGEGKERAAMAVEVAKKLKVSEAFSVPRGSKQIIMKALRTEVPHYTFRVSDILPTKKFSRIWRTR